MIASLLILAAVVAAYVAGRVHEGSRSGGTVDLAARVAHLESALDQYPGRPL